jgi:hypothetical protein
MEKVNEIRRAIKELEERHILLTDMMIVYEIDCQLDRELTDEEYMTLYSNVEYAYFKLEGVSLESIVACGIDNLDKLDDEDFDFREECCYYV